MDYTETAFGLNMKMIWVEGGVLMRNCVSEYDTCDYKKGVRCVSIDGFYIGVFEVTQSQWEAVIGTTIYQQRDKVNPQWQMAGVGVDYPMYYVNWDEAMEFCRLLSNRTGKNYTLPTETQWEYAASGGKNGERTLYAGSNNIDDVAWYTENSGDSTHICGTKISNSLGLYDMSGNVWEWCRDWYGYDFNDSETYNPTGPTSGYYRVIRGGSWGRDAIGCRIDYRRFSSPTNSDCFMGFRVVCIP